MTDRRSDRGSATTEAVIVAPVAIVLLCLVALVGRTATAREQVDEAARDAARAASLERHAGAARSAAQDSASASLADGGFRCAATGVDVDTGRFAPGGTVAVTVRCDIPLADLGLVGIGGTRTVEARAVSVIDTWRGTP